MRLSTRYGLVGISALALLFIGHWLRDQVLAANTAPEPTSALARR